jgi:cytochrome P450
VLDFFDPVFRADPYPTWRRLREEAPVLETPLGFVLTRYADCLAVLKDPRCSNQVTAMSPDGERGSFLVKDPPDHTRLRGLVAKAFTPKVVEGLRHRIVTLVDEILDRLADAGGGDIVTELAFPLPAIVIAEMLGVPASDREQFKVWSAEVAAALDPEAPAPTEASAALEAYFEGLVEERRAAPTGDMISELIRAEEQGDRLTHRELLSTLILLLVAGHETTVNLIGNGTLALLGDADARRRWRDDPSLDRTAVEEILRYDPPVQLDSRLLTADMPVGDVVMPEGSMVFTALGSANRDPGQFDDPERLDLGRTDNRHLAFGFGIHHCLGAPLARAEGQIALSRLIRRFPDIEQAGPAPYKGQIVLRGPAAVPVSVR